MNENADANVPEEVRIIDEKWAQCKPLVHNVALRGIPISFDKRGMNCKADVVAFLSDNVAPICSALGLTLCANFETNQSARGEIHVEKARSFFERLQALLKAGVLHLDRRDRSFKHEFNAVVDMGRAFSNIEHHKEDADQELRSLHIRTLLSCIAMAIVMLVEGKPLSRVFVGDGQRQDLHKRWGSMLVDYVNNFVAPRDALQTSAVGTASCSR